MEKKSHNRRKGVVYSTDPDYEYRYQDEEGESLLPEDQRLRVQMEKKGRAGKTVTVIHGFEGNSADLKELAKKLKNHCGAGGSSKDGLVIIQGDHKQKAISFLRSEGYGDVK